MWGEAMDWPTWITHTVSGIAGASLAFIGQFVVRFAKQRADSQRDDTKLLLDSLFSRIASLESAQTELVRKLAECEANHEAARQRIDSMEKELAALRTNPKAA